MRRSFIQIEGVLYEKGTEPMRASKAPMVMADIKPYKSMIDGSEITSRSKHREHLRIHRCVEVGNETKYLQPKPLTSPPGLKETIIRATEEVMNRQRR